MSLKETIAKIRAAVDAADHRFPVDSLGLEIGTADDYFVWEDEDDGSVRVLYYNFKPLPQLATMLAGWDNIVIDFEKGIILKFDNNTDEWDIAWDFPMRLIEVLAKASE